jgi:hypothetical protein
MSNKSVLDCLSPCDIRCETCLIFTEGGIAARSRKLAEELGNLKMKDMGVEEYFDSIRNDHRYP